MEKYRITKKQSECLKVLIGFKNNPENYYIEEDQDGIFIITEDIEDLLDAIADYIYFRCLDEEYICNEEGRSLYAIHDELAYRDPDGIL